MARELHELSDEEFSKLTPAEIAEMTAAPAGDDAGNGEGNDDGKVEVDEAAAAGAAVLNSSDDDADAAAQAAIDAANAAKDDKSDDEAEAAAQAAATAAAAGKADAKVDPAKAADAGTGKAAVDADGKAKVDDPVKVDPAAAIDYKAQYEELIAPFKANGRDIQVSNVAEARQLMSMGANYNKKMQAMKPHLATLRTLENAKIGEAELNFLIDVHNRNPEAINKLVKDSGIDPMDLSAEKADGYVPKNHKPSNSEIELETVLNELDGSEGLPKTVEIVSQLWDANSKGVIAQNPNILRTINAHVETGIYDLVASEIERKRTFGQLAGLSDLEAYRQVGDAMYAEGKFEHLTGSPQKSQQAAAPAVIKAPDPKKADDDKRKEQKRDAAPAKAATPAAKNPDFNPLSMSDEDFAKLTIKT